jgi:hypothetical protein
MSMANYFRYFCWLFPLVGWSAVSDHLRVLQDKSPVSSIRNIDYIYVINLDHRREKYEQTVQELAPYGIVPYRFSAVNGWKLPIEVIWDVSLEFKEGMRLGGMGTVYKIDPENKKEYLSHEIVDQLGERYLVHCASRGMIGCLLSHLTVMQDALFSDYEVVWICEDDIEVVRNPYSLSSYIDDLDRIVGRENWDVLFTFRDYRGPNGEYIVAYGANYRPNIDTHNQEQFMIDKPISDELRQVGTRFGTQSMIWTRQGIEKVLKFYDEYKCFIPYDMDLVLVPNIRMYSTRQDVVTNRLNALTDLGYNYEEHQ